MAPSNNNGGGSSPSTPRRSDHSGSLTHRRHHSIANDTINDMVGSISTPTPPSSAPRTGIRRHNRHATHSHIDLDINNYTEDGLSDWSIGGAVITTTTTRHHHDSSIGGHATTMYASVPPSVTLHDQCVCLLHKREEGFLHSTCHIRPYM